jgi:tetratricopeptide (TPR) repeat protein
MLNIKKCRVARERGVLRHLPLATRHLRLLAAALLFLAGCTPPGPKAFLEGKRLLDKGDYRHAVEKLKLATSFLPTNALAWNCLGVAYQSAGARSEAEAAYRHALELDRDLMEAHYNLGGLYLEQNPADKLDAARMHLMAFTIRRSSAEGLAKLGTAQLRLKEAGPAEKSFSEALKLNPGYPEALNGLALARLQRGRTAEAAQVLGTLLQKYPAYPAALLNAAVLEQQYTHNRASALKYYRQYAALRPPPEDAEQVAAVIRQLELELAPTPAFKPLPGTAPATSSATLNASAVAAPVAKDMAAPGVPKTNAALASLRPRVAPPQPMPTITIALSPSTNSTPQTPRPNVSNSPLATRQSPPPTALTTSAPVAAPSEIVKLRSEPQVRTADDSAPAPAIKLPARAPDSGTAPPASSGESKSPRYVYRSPARPTAGNRALAEQIFTEGLQEQQKRRFQEAQAAYRRSTQADPSFFKSHFNLAVVLTESGDLRSALPEYELALAIDPESADARYNFGLGLKQCGFLVDAVSEFDRVLAAKPAESRAHLALGNLFAQQLQQPVKARTHYLRVLELDPRNPQANAIRYWLSANP